MFTQVYADDGSSLDNTRAIGARTEGGHRVIVSVTRDERGRERVEVVIGREVYDAGEYIETRDVFEHAFALGPDVDMSSPASE